MKRLGLLFLAGLCFAAADSDEQAALDRISAADMRGNLSFLSSDLLEGRDTPSRGLDIAAEFIASQFRRAGLEPVFQVAEYLQVMQNSDGMSVTIDADGKTLELKNLRATNLSPVDLKSAPLFKIDSSEIPSLEGKIAVLEAPTARDNFTQYQERVKLAQQQHAAALLIFGPGARRGGANAPRLVEAKLPEVPPSLVVSDADGSKLLKDLAAGDTNATLSAHINAPKKTAVQLRNVAGLLKGSDPELAKTYVLVTAHYDHIGVKPTGDGDRIYNGANDDGSGTVSVIEIANALAAMKQHPKRSILFMTFFGEEKGLFGSHYYAAHPLYPLKNTVAQINLEQLGRTDDTEGPQVASATFTGFDFSDLPATFEEAGKATGIKVYKNEKNSDAFFARSDNQSLADAGIPAHTLAVAFEFSDYHAVGDEWQKIDYDNMAKVDRMIALGLLTISNRAEPPHWNEKNSKTAKYVEAAKNR